MNLSKRQQQEITTPRIAGARPETTGTALPRQPQQPADRAADDNQKSQQLARFGTIRWDFASGMITPSGLLKEMYSIPPDRDQIPFREFVQLVHEDDRLSFEKALRRASRHSSPSTIEYRISPHQKTVRHLQMSGIPECDNKDLPVGWYATVQDVTELRMMQASLQASRIIAESLFEGSPEPLFIIDRDGVIVQGNRQAEVLFQEKMVTLIDKPLRMLLPAFPIEKVFRRQGRHAGQVDLGTSEIPRKGNSIRVGVQAIVLEMHRAAPLAIVTVVERRSSAKVSPRVSTDGGIESWAPEVRNEDASERLTLSLEAAHQRAFEHDLIANTLRWSPLPKDMLLFDPEHPNPDPAEWMAMILPEDRSLLEQSLQHILSNGKECEITYRVLNHHGDIRWVVGHGRAAYDAGGNPLRIYGIVRDITERRNAEQELYLLTQRLRLHLENSPLGVIELDPAWRIISWSNEAERIFGWRAEDVKGKKIWDFGWICDEDIPLVRRLCEEMASGTRTKDFHVNRNYRKDGNIIHCRWYNSAIFDTSGNLISVLSFALDITEEVYAAERLHLAQAGANAGIWDWNIQRDTVTWTDEYFRLLGLEPGSVVPTPTTWLNSIHPEDRRMVERAVVKAVERNEAIVDLQFRILRPTGEIRWLRRKGQIIYNEHGTPLRMIGLSIDVTEQKEIEQLLRESEEQIQKLNADLEERVAERTQALTNTMKELESFSYSVSHDLRAPLRHIDGFVQLLLEESNEQFTGTSKQYLDIISSAAKQMGALIDDLLAFSRAGRLPMTSIDIDMNGVIRQAISELRSLTSGRSIQWSISELPHCFGDTLMLRLAWMNLLSNALKFTRTRAVVKIEIGGHTTEQGESAYFIRDNGVGFDMKYYDKLFGVFQRLHREEEFEGTGIGLANVKRIIERHGGRIWAEAEIEQGATFYFCLPAQPKK